MTIQKWQGPFKLGYTHRIWRFLFLFLFENEVNIMKKIYVYK